MSLITPFLLVIATWWLGTGVVLYLQQRIETVRTPLIMMLCITSLSALGMMLSAANGLQPWNSYVGFVAAVVLWGCIELSYYTGLITGIHTQACPANCTTSERFRYALGASMWHELSALFAGGVVLTLLYTAQNPAGLYSFLVLWLMRWSAKLNLFFGVPNFNTDWFPKRLAYAHSYIRRAPVGLFFAVSVLLAGYVAMQMIKGALSQPPPVALSVLLPGALLILAILEHVFMALPIADSKLWNRIFARELEATLSGKLHNDESISIDEEQVMCIHERSQSRVNKALIPSNNRPISVTLTPVKASTTHPVS